MRTTWLIVLMLTVASAGCQRRNFLKSGELATAPNAEPTDAYKDELMARSLDRYARKHHLSREEAARQLRREANEAAAAGLTCGCGAASPTSGGAVRPASATLPGHDNESPVDRATYFDAPPSGAPLRR